jgi:hypothetical protein
MYTTCLFCKHSLGANEVLERFPIGRRVAFDAEKGRLWVVCTQCERWNLTPLEERWEAIEQAEGLYRDTRLRVSTEHIGLARLPEGLELVRIGRPQRPEIAAWRYGDQFGRRRRKRIIAAGAVLAGGALALAGGVAVGIGTWGLVNIGNLAWTTARQGMPGRTIATLRDDANRLIRVKHEHLKTSRILSGPDGSLAFQLSHTRGQVHLEGSLARRAAAVLFPAVNRFGGTKEDVQRAVTRLQDAGDAERFLTRIAVKGERLTPIASRHRDWTGESGDDDSWSGLLALPTSTSLAIEMALHEEQERRALEGELHELERAWRDAEEIGAIADSLLLPPWIEGALKRMR